MSIKVAVIDSGIDVNHEVFRNNRVIDYSAGKVHSRWQGKRIGLDSNGHGTACASVIVNECPNVDIFSIGILDSEGKTKLSVLESALESLICSDVSIINMSLAFDKLVDKKMYQLCQELSRQDITIISSLANKCEESYPAEFDNVIGVQWGILEEENAFWFNKHKTIQCVMDCLTSVVAVPSNEYNMIFPCNSIATAKLTGIISKMLWDEHISKISLTSLYNWLQRKALRNNWNDEETYERFRVPEQGNWFIEDNDPVLKKTYRIVCRYFGKELLCNRICDIELLTNKGLLRTDHVIPFLKFFEKRINKKINYLKINRYHLITIGTLVKYIKSL